MRIQHLFISIIFLISIVHGYSGTHEIDMLCDLSEGGTAYVEGEVTFTNLLQGMALKDVFYINVENLFYFSVRDALGPLEYELKNSSMIINFRKPVYYKEKVDYGIKFYTGDLIDKKGSFYFSFDLIFYPLNNIPVRDLELLIKLPEGAIYREYYPEPDRIFIERGRTVFYYDLSPILNVTKIKVDYDLEEKKISELKELKIKKEKEERSLELERLKNDLINNISTQRARINALENEINNEKDLVVYLSSLDIVKDLLRSSEEKVYRFELEESKAILISAIYLIKSVERNIEKYKEDLENKRLNLTFNHIKKAEDTLVLAEKKINELNKSSFVWIEPNTNEINTLYLKSKNHYERALDALEIRDYSLAKEEAEKSRELAYQTIYLIDEEREKTNSRKNLLVLGSSLCIFSLFFSSIFIVIRRNKEENILRKIKKEYRNVSQDYEFGFISREEYERRIEVLYDEVTELYEKLR